MKPKIKFKIFIDLVMTVLLLCQMAYMLIGETIHEWIGVTMFVLFILHHILNVNWYQNLAKGKYSPLRTIQTAVNFSVLISMVALMVSGIILSREVFAFLPIHSGMGLSRILHMLAAYWGFILMSIHLGLHWGMVTGMARKMIGGKRSSAAWIWILRGLALVICCIGVYSFFINNIADYLFMRSQFVFFDMEQPLPLFFLEYLSMMGLWVCLAYYGARWLQKRSSGQKATKAGGSE